MTTYYADYSGGSDSNTGLSHAQRWKTMAKANAVCTTSDVLLWLCGTSNTAETCRPTWGGVDGNHGVVGAYYVSGSEVRGVSGTKPLFKGGNDPYYGFWVAGGTPELNQKVVQSRNNAYGYVYKVTVAGTFHATTETAWTTTIGDTTPNGSVTLQCLGIMQNSLVNYRGLFEKPPGKSYFTFENLKGSNFYGIGMLFDDTTPSTKIYAQSIDLDATGKSALTMARNVTYCVIDNSKGTGSTWNKCGMNAVGAGFGHDISGGNHGWLDVGFSNSVSAETNYNTIDGITVTKCAREGVVQHAYNVFKNCVVWNTYCGAYLTGGHHNKCFNNLFIGGPDANLQWSGGYCGPAVIINNEGSGVGLGGSRINNEYHDVYNNLSAWMRWTIHMGDSSVVTGGVTVYTGQNCNIVHNTGVDNLYAIACWGNSYPGTAIKNNLFARYTAGTMLYSWGATVGSKSNNLWPTTPPSGLSGTGDIISTSPGLTKTSGWQGATAYNSITSADFVPSSTSPVIAAGTLLASPFDVDALGNSRTVRTDIGALQAAASADVTAPTVPGTPGSFSGVSTSGMSFSFTASTDAVGVTVYRVYKDTVLHDTSATNSYTATGLVSNTSYSWTVSAGDAAGNYSAQSAAGVQATLSPTDTTAPTFGGLTGISADVGNNITLTWTQATDAVTAQGSITYDIYHSTTSGAYDYNTAEFTHPIGVGTVIINGYAPGTHYFVMRARDLAGNRDTNTVEQSILLPEIGMTTIRVRMRERLA